jgi:hypothetical protein
MKKIKKLYHFLGSVYFALILIFAVTIFVISGTFIEAATQSHRYAAIFTYNSPLFALLLWGFFINIFFSATRRWPFKKKHIPFLTTHLGLLMLIAGVLAKHYWGIQGTMSLNEGTASQEILEPNTFIVYLENRNGKQAKYPLKKSIWGKHLPEIAKNEDITIQLIEYYPHCHENLTSWIHGAHAFLIGFPPLPLSEALLTEEPLPQGGTANLQSSNDSSWNLYALKTNDLAKTLDKLYTQNAQLKISERITGSTISLKKLNNVALKINAQNELIDPQVKIQWQNFPKITISLTGENSLLNIPINPQLGSLPIAVDIIQQPFFAIIKDQDHNIFLFAADTYGKIWFKSYPKGTPDLLVAYDDGFAGYTTKIELPFKSHQTGRKEREDAVAYQLTTQLRKAVEAGSELSPPLQLLHDACKKTDQDFAEIITSFLSHWNSSNEWLYPENLPLPENQKQIFHHIDWKKVPTIVKQGCEWVVDLFKLIDLDLKKHGNLLAALRDKNWPLLPALEAEIATQKNLDETSAYTLLTHQLFAAAELVPIKNNDHEAISPEAQASLLSAYLRAYGIHLASLLQVPKEEKEMDQLLINFMQEKQKDLNLETTINLESPVASVSIPAIPTKKLEENRPKIKVIFTKEEKKQGITLTYDPSGKGLKWPILHGEHLTRFQPSVKEIPYRVRLRQARQINYPNSTQPYSFESDIIITDQRNHKFIEKTISMNNVHETWDGYRFYLSSIAPANETAIRHIQIVVNHDPAKYRLTYPGAIVLSCGILMLFITRPYRKSKL